MSKSNHKGVRNRIFYLQGIILGVLLVGVLAFGSDAKAPTAETLQSSQEQLVANIEAQKAKLLEMMKENRKRRAEVEDNYNEMIRQADFYAKPVYPSTQVFFSYHYENSGKGKNKTKSEWENTLDAIAGRAKGDVLPKGKNPYHDGEVISFNNGSMQSVGYLPNGTVNEESSYRYNDTTNNSNVSNTAGYNNDVLGYDPNLDPSTLPSSVANKYIKPVYLTDANGNQVVKSFTGSEPTVTDAAGNTYYVVTETDPVSGRTSKFVVNKAGVAVETDSDGNVIVSNTLLDPNINGKPNNLVSAEDPNPVLLSGNGVYIKQDPHFEPLDIGANIKPLDPEIPNVAKDVSVSVTTPDMPQALTAPVDPTAPSDVNISVSKPQVSVTAPNPVTVPPVGVPSVTPIDVPADQPINEPTLPDIATYDPKTINEPIIPSAPEVQLPSLPTFALSAGSDGNGPQSWYFKDNGQNSKISEVAVLTGDFKISRSDDGFSGTDVKTKWSYDIKNYSATNIGVTATSGDDFSGDVAYSGSNVRRNIPDKNNSASPTSYVQYGFFRNIGGPLFFKQGVDIEYQYTPTAATTSATTVRELVHQDTHAWVNSTASKNDAIARFTFAGASPNGIEGYRYIEQATKVLGVAGGTPTGKNWNDFKSNAFLTEGNITMIGSNMSITNQYDHNTGAPWSPGAKNVKTFGVNNGKVIIKGGTSNAVFTAAGSSYGDGYAYVMYNGDDGEIIVNTDKSAGYLFGKFDDATEKNMIAGNDGLFVMSGDGSAYISRNDSAKGLGYVTFYDDPFDKNGITTFLGTNSVTADTLTYADTGLVDNRTGQGNTPTGMAYIFGNGSLGVYIPAGTATEIGSGAGRGIRLAVGGYSKPYFSSSNVIAETKNSIGFYVANKNVDLDYHEIHVNGNTALNSSGYIVNGISQQNVGVYVGTGDIDLGYGVISVNGGMGNVGVYAKNNNISTNGAIIIGNGKVEQKWQGNQDGTDIKIHAVAIEKTTSDPIGENIEGFAPVETPNPNGYTPKKFSASQKQDNKDYSTKYSYNIEYLNNSTSNGTTADGIEYFEASPVDLSIPTKEVLVNVGGYVVDGKTIDVDYLGGMGSENTIALYASDSLSKINVNKDVEIVGMTVTDPKSNAMAAFATKNAEITLNNSRKAGIATYTNSASTPVNYYNRYPDISVTGMESSISGSYVGMGLFASDGGQIMAKDMYIKVSQGAAGVASIGADMNPSKVDITDSTIYSDNGYALYTKDSGTIDATNTTLVLDGVDFENSDFDKNLDGKSDITGNDVMTDSDGDGLDDTTHKKLVDELSATAMEIPMDGSSNGITASGDIYIKSNQVVVYNLTDLPSSGENLSNLKAAINGVAPYTITDDGIHKTWKLGAIDGGTLIVDTPIVESSTDSGSALSDADIFFHRLLMQNSKIEISGTGSVTSDINGTHMNNYDEGDVPIAVKMTSANTDKLVDKNTSEIINNATITAARADSGAGAIGAYMNYGTVTNAGSIDIENATTNVGGIGIAGVNGSNITNSGDITVGGINGVGIASLAYKETVVKDPATGAPIAGRDGKDVYAVDSYDPFNKVVTADKDGTTKIENSNMITVIGDGSVGIYGRNNDRRAAEGVTIPPLSEEGKVEIVNNGTIDSSTGEGSLGIVAIGNGKSQIDWAAAPLAPIISPLPGIIPTRSELTSTSVENNGTIMVGKNGFGIYANGVYDHDLSVAAGPGQKVYTPGYVNIYAGGTLDLIGDNAIGIYMDENTLLSDNTGITATNSTATNTTKKAVLYIKSTSTDGKILFDMSNMPAMLSGIISTPIDMTASANTTGILAKDRIVAYHSDMKVGDKGVGLYANNSIAINGGNPYITTLNPSALPNSIITLVGQDASGVNTGYGMVTSNGALANRNGNTINLGDPTSPSGSSSVQIGMVVDGGFAIDGTNMTVSGGFAYNDGDINLNSPVGGIGIYAKNGAYAALNNNGAGIAFNGTNGFGAVADNATVGISSTVDHGAADLAALGFPITLSWTTPATFNPQTTLGGSDAINNTYVVAQNGSTVVNQGLVVGSTGNSSPDGTIGIYLKGDKNTYEDFNGAGATILGGHTTDGVTTVTPQLTVYDGAVGIYSEADGTGTPNEVLINASVTPDMASSGTNKYAVGAYIKGKATIGGDISVRDNGTGDSAVGIYGTDDTITVRDQNTDGNGLAFTLNDTATGMYMTNGATATGDDIYVNNISTTANAGIYYDGVTGIHDTNIKLDGSKVVGIFANNGSDISSAKDIVEQGTGTGTERYAMIAGESTATNAAGNSTVRNNGNITLGSKDSILMYTENGTIENNGTLTSTGTADGTEAAMATSANSGSTSDTINVINNGTIIANNSLGMVVDGSSPTTTGTATNAGNIIATATPLTTSSGDKKPAIGVAMFGDGSNVNATFDGTGGTITANGEYSVGMYMSYMVAGQVTAFSDMSVNNLQSVGIYANNAVIDKDVNMSGTDGIGVYAQNGSSVANATIDATGMTQGTALYLSDASTDLSNAAINVGSNVTGIFVKQGPYALGSNSGDVTVNTAGTASTGVYIAPGQSVSLDTGAHINADNGATGVYINGSISGSAAVLDTNGGDMTLGVNTVGVFASGADATANLGVAGPMTVNFTDPSAILAFNKYGDLVIGNNLVINGTGTLGFVYNGNLDNQNTSIIVNNGQTGYFATYDSTGSGPYNVKNTGSIAVNAGGTGIVVNNDTTSPLANNVTLSNQGTMTVDGAKAVGLFSNYDTVDNSTGNIAVTNNGTGIFVNENIANVDVGTLNVTSATGLVINDTAAVPSVAGTMTLQNGTSTNYSIGTYYLNQGNTGASVINTLPAVNQGSYSIAAAIDGATNTVNQQITTPGTGTDQIGLYVTNGADTTLTNGVAATGDTNIGTFVNNSTVKIPNTISVSNSTESAAAPYSPAAVGVYAKHSNVMAENQTLNVGANSIGVSAERSTVDIGTINTDNKAIGVYTKDNATTIVDTAINAGVSAYGVFAKDSTVDATKNDNVSMHVADGTAIGILSLGSGDVDFTGNAVVDAKDATGTNKASIAIYKANGTGTVTTKGTMNIGKGGYAVYAENKDYAGAGMMAVENYADINLGESSVGIYANGNMNKPSNVTATNFGTINVGTSYKVNPDHTADPGDLNGVGMYISHGATGYNDKFASINVPYDHSVGAYVRGAETSAEDGANKTLTTFHNYGHILADAGGVGILAKGYTQVINEEDGIVETGYNKGLLADGTECTNSETIGIAAYGTDQDHKATVINNGTIKVGDGIGVYLNKYAVLENNGTITFDDGIGISSVDGADMAGNAPVTGLDGNSNGINGSATATVASGFPHGAINILGDGTVVINNQFVHAGVIVADNLRVDGTVVDITKEPNFNVNSIEGNIQILNNFIITGNGYAWTVNNFVTNINQNAPNWSAPTLNVNTSPLFAAHITDDGGLTVAKQPYAYLVAGTQFDNLYNGVDSLLALDQAGTGKDSEALKSLNSYLNNEYYENGNTVFAQKADLTLAEMRGDIYSTIQKRMQNVQHAFDNSFDELLDSYNFSRDTGKYSVIRTDGKYKDDTLGIDDYDYNVTGLLYMKEYEGRRYNDKWGYTLGFAVSKFKFDDDYKFGDKSKEDVYSVRAGVHNVHSFGDEDRLRLVSRLELGYNRHEAKRVIELDKKYKNKGNYNTFNITLDNRLEKTLFRNLSTDVKVYAGLNLEYGHVGKFTEKDTHDSALELDVKSNNYLSIEPEIGVAASKRLYIGKKVSAKVTGDVGYGYELGKNYKRNKARVNGGTEGYYSLIKPEDEKGAVKAKVGLTLEKADHYGVTFEVGAEKHQNRKDADMTYGVRFNYKFGGGR